MELSRTNPFDGFLESRIDTALGDSDFLIHRSSYAKMYRYLVELEKYPTFIGVINYGDNSTRSSNCFVIGQTESEIESIRELGILKGNMYDMHRGYKLIGSYGDQKIQFKRQQENMLGFNIADLNNNDGRLLHVLIQESPTHPIESFDGNRIQNNLFFEGIVESEDFSRNPTFTLLPRANLLQEGLDLRIDFEDGKFYGYRTVKVDKITLSRQF